MTSDQMADIHARAFEGQGRAWSTDEFTQLKQDPHVFDVQAPFGFALGRVIADEAELLTIATDPAYQGQGIGRAILQILTTEAAQLGAKTVFLEVARDNMRALRLYKDFGYQEVGCRFNYYRRPDGTSVDALVLEAEIV